MRTCRDHTEVGVIRTRWWATTLGVVALGGSVSGTAGAAVNGPGGDRLGQVDHIVVIYQENHSFDNLYGGWESVRGLGAADAAHTRQVNQAGAPFTCLQQNDVNLAALPGDCTDTTTGTAFTSHFPNAPFLIDTFIPATA